MLSTYSAHAQLVGDLLLDDIAITNQRFEGSEFQIDLPDGTRCQSQQGTPPQISFYGGSSRRADKHDVNTGDSDYKSGGLAAGAIITIPIGSQTKRNCDRSYELHLLTKKLELATLMFEQGLVDEDEIAGLIQQAKQILNLQSSPDKFVRELPPL